MDYPNRNTHCLLFVKDLKNVFGWSGPIIGAWNGEEWLIRQYLPEMNGGSFLYVPAKDLEVLNWIELNNLDYHLDILKFKQEWAERFGFLAIHNAPDSYASIYEVACILNNSRYGL